MQTTIVRINENHIGTWDETIEYIEGDRVTRHGSTYLALMDNSNSMPEFQPMLWQLRLTASDERNLFDEDNQLLVKVLADDGLTLVEGVVGGSSAAEGSLITVDADPSSSSGITFTQFQLSGNSKSLLIPTKDLPARHPDSRIMDLAKPIPVIGDSYGILHSTIYLLSNNTLLCCGLCDYSPNRPSYDVFPNPTQTGINITADNVYLPTSTSLVTIEGIISINKYRTSTLMELVLTSLNRVYGRALANGNIQGFQWISAVLEPGVVDQPEFVELFTGNFLSQSGDRQATGAYARTLAGELYYYGYNFPNHGRLGSINAAFSLITNFTRVTAPGTFISVKWGHNNAYVYFLHSNGDVTFSGRLQATECGNAAGIRFAYNNLPVVFPDPVVKIEVSGTHFNESSITTVDSRYKNTFLTNSGVVYSLEFESGAFVQGVPIVDPDITDNNNIVDIWSVRLAEFTDSTGAEYCLIYLRGDPAGTEDLQLRIVCRGTFIGLTTTDRGDFALDPFIVGRDVMEGNFKAKAGPGCFHWVNSNGDLMGIGHNHDGRLGVGNTTSFVGARRCLGVFGIVADWEYQQVGGTGRNLLNGDFATNYRHFVITKVFYTNGRASACGSNIEACLGTVVTAFRGETADFGDTTVFHQVSIG